MASGIGLSTLNVVGTANAVTEKAAIRELGLENEYIEVLQEQGVEKATEILEKNNVEYVHNKSKITGRDLVDSDFSTEGRYTKTESEIDVSIGRLSRGDNLWYAAGNVIFIGAKSTVRDVTQIADAIGITWPDSDWTGERPDSDGVNYWSTYDNSEHDIAPSTHDISHEDYDTGTGVAGSVDITYSMPQHTIVGMGVPIERIRPGANAVQFNYKHNYAFSYITGSASISICAGALCVTLPWGASTAWDIERAILID